MSKKKIAIISAIAGVAVILVACILIVTLNKPQTTTPNNPDSSSSSEVSEPLDKVDDVKDNITVDNFKAKLEAILGNEYNIEEGQSTYMYRMGYEQFRVSDATNYSGTEKNGKDTFSGIITNGISNNPDFSISFTTYSKSQQEIEDKAYEIVKALTSEEIENQLKNSDYNKINLVEVNSEEYQDITLSKTVETMESVSDYFDEESSTEICKTYTFGVHYNAYKEELKKEYEFRDYDKLLFTNIPVFAKTGTSDITYSLVASNFVLLQNASKLDVTAYNYEHSNNGDTCMLEIVSYAKSGEKLTSTFTCKYDNTSDLMDYAVKTMTGYEETPEVAFDTSINLINGITGLEISKEMFINISDLDESSDNTNELEKTYILASEDDELSDITIDITICKESGLGYYALINIM